MADKLTPFGKEVRRQLDRLYWPQARLAEESGVDPASISRMMRGLQEPTHPAVEAIADALGVDVQRLKKLAGLRVITPPAERDLRAEYIAQRLDEMPPELRATAADALEAMLNAIYEVTETAELRANDPELFGRAWRRVTGSDVPGNDADGNEVPGGTE